MVTVVVLAMLYVSAVLAMAALPFLLPWPQQVRWLVNSVYLADPYSMSVVGVPLNLREVTVADVVPSAVGTTLGLTGSPDATRVSWYELRRGGRLRHGGLPAGVEDPSDTPSPRHRRQR